MRTHRERANETVPDRIDTLVRALAEAVSEHRNNRRSQSVTGRMPDDTLATEIAAVTRDAVDKVVMLADLMLEQKRRGVG